MHPVWVAMEHRPHGHEAESEALFAAVLPRHATRDPDNPDNRGRAYYYARRWEDAETVYASIRASRRDDPPLMGFHGVVLAKLDRRAEALAISDRLGQFVYPNLRRRVAVDMGRQAAIAAALGDRDDAVRLARQAFNTGWSYGIGLHRDPAWNDMRGYPPWESLVAPPVGEPQEIWGRGRARHDLLQLRDGAHRRRSMSPRGSSPTSRFLPTSRNPLQR